MVQKAIKLAKSNNLQVHSVTCDGTAVNVKTMSMLGCKWLDDDLNGELDLQFTEGLEVHLILDPCQALKLAQYAIVHMQTLCDKDGKAIQWWHVQRLKEIQESKGLKFANKLRCQHVDFQRCKMKLCVAVQTLSRSVAETIGFLR